MTDVRLSWLTRAGLRLKHTGLLGREVARFAGDHRLWWLLPLVVVIMLFAVAVSATTTALPVAVYTLF